MSELSSIYLNEPANDPSSGVFISLGSNQSYLELSSRELLVRALEALDSSGDRIVATSSFWKSDAWPTGAGAPDYINAVCQILPLNNDPAGLLLRLHNIEAKFGRLRDPLNRWSSRSLDLDLLDYNGQISPIDSVLTLPHPQIAVRDFVLLPLLQVSPSWVHPITKKSARILLEELEGDGFSNNCIQISL